MLRSKKSKGIVSLVICLGMFLGISSFALDTKEGTGISDAVIDFFEEQGVTVSKNATLEVVPVQSGNAVSSTLATANANMDKAVCITEQSGNEITKNYFIFYKEDENGGYIVDNTLPYTIQDVASANSYIPPISLGNAIMVYASPSYLVFSGVYYRPTGLAWSYSTSGTGSVSVSSVNVYYYTSGVLCSYPDYVDISKSTHFAMTSIVANPSVYTGYVSYSSPLSSTRVIDISRSAGGGAIFVTATINNCSYEDSIPLYQ